MPWLPAPISQSTCGATCLKSISPSLRNGVVIGGITPVGRIFMASPRCFHSRVIAPLCRHGGRMDQPNQAQDSKPAAAMTQQPTEKAGPCLLRRGRNQLTGLRKIAAAVTPDRPVGECL